MAQVVDLQGVLRGLRRRGQVALAIVAVCVIVAATFVALSPTVYVAKAQVVLPPSPVNAQGNDTRDITTEVQVVLGQAVLGPAISAVTPPITLPALTRELTVRGLSPQIIEIEVRSDNAARAALLANAVATSYVAYSDDTATSESNTTEAAYSQQVNQLDQQVTNLEQQIDTSTAALVGLPAAEMERREDDIDDLRTEQSALAQQLTVDQTQIANAQLQASLSKQGTQVLQPALTPNKPASPKPLEDIGLGAAAGVLLGALGALAVENGDHRLRTRDGVSEAIGSPVLASLAVPSVDRRDRSQAFLEHWEPSVVETYALRQAFDHLELLDGHSANLALVGLAGDAAAPVLAIELGLFSASWGTQTAFVFASHDEGNAALRASLASSSDGLNPRPGLSVHGATSGVEADALVGAQLIITFLVAGPGPIVVPTWDYPTRAALVVSAGFAAADRLEAVAASCADAGAPLRGAFVANPDGADRTTGQRGRPLDAGPTAWSGSDHRLGAEGSPERAPRAASSNGANGAVLAPPADSTAGEVKPPVPKLAGPAETELPG